MEERIKKLEDKIAELERQQLRLPIDTPSMKAITEGFRTVRVPRIYVDNIFLTTGNSVDPSTEGQIVYHENGGTQVLKVYIDGAVKTFDLT